MILNFEFIKQHPELADAENQIHAFPLELEIEEIAWDWEINQEDCAIWYLHINGVKQENFYIIYSGHHEKCVLDENGKCGEDEAHGYGWHIKAQRKPTIPYGNGLYHSEWVQTMEEAQKAIFDFITADYNLNPVQEAVAV